MNLDRGGNSETRFAEYVAGLGSVIGHAERTKPLRDYCTGLMLPGERKSVEPMAARTAPARTSAQHQSLLHFVGIAAWSDEDVLAKVREMGDLHRVILGTDAPAGSGVQPLGILRMVSMLSSLGDLPAEIAFCLATGNTARMRELDCGLIEVGRSADFVIMDKAQHSAGKNILDSVQLGDLPGIGMTIIDGIVRTQRSRNTPPAGRVPEVVAK